MAQLIVRNLDEGVAEALRQRARANERSMEAEVRTILGDVVSGSTGVPVTDFALAARRLRERLGDRGTDSAALVREGRDGRI
jgi:antitoxin FitA